MAQSSSRSSGKAPARPRSKAGTSKSGASKAASSHAQGAPEPTQPGFLARFFSAVARAAVGVASLPKGVQVEAEAVLVLNA